MQLASKMRFVSAQLNALFENKSALAVSNAKHANQMAQKLYEGVVAIAAKSSLVTVPNATEANAVFPILPEEVTNKLLETYRFYVWNQATGQIRWMCAWDTQESDVDGLIAALDAAVS
jgi:threonine aldolase